MFPLLKAPKDIIRLLIHDYFAAPEALICYTLCKRIYQVVDRDILVRKMLEYKSIKYFQDQVAKLIICPVCQIVLQKKEQLPKHLEKHKRSERIFPGKRFIESKCISCNMPTSNSTHHICYLLTKSCYNEGIRYFFEWADSLCDPGSWYVYDPKNYNREHNHICKAKCKLCDHIFDTEIFDENHHNGFGQHYLTCSKREEMILKYHLQGDKTDEEWKEYKLIHKDCVDIYTMLSL